MARKLHITAALRCRPILAGIVATKPLQHGLCEVLVLRSSVHSRRKSIGEALLRHATEQAKLAGVKTLLVRVGAHTHFVAASELLRKEGWNEGYRFHEAYGSDGTVFLKKDV